MEKLESKSDDDDQGNQGGDANQSGDGVKRRRRGDAGDRNYTCGCGKSYLSYPALYTHIKTKHNGVIPDGTLNPKSNGKTGRGRPKKEDSANKVKEEDKGENFETDSGNANENVINYLRNLGEKRMSEDKDDELNPIVSDTPDSFDLVMKFPVTILRPEDYSPVLNELANICKSKNIGTEEVDKDSGLKKSNINKIFAIFIYSIGRHLREEFYAEFVFFLMMYRRALNEIGWLIKAETSKQGISEAERRIEYCVSNNGEYVPDVCNDFITDKWTEYLPQYNTSSFTVLGSDTDSIKNAVFLTQHFCNWLNYQRYTNSRLLINEDDEE